MATAFQKFRRQAQGFAAPAAILTASMALPVHAAIEPSDPLEVAALAVMTLAVYTATLAFLVALLGEDQESGDQAES